jgi:hypothetical protein
MSRELGTIERLGIRYAYEISNAQLHNRTGFWIELYSFHPANGKTIDLIHKKDGFPDKHQALAYIKKFMSTHTPFAGALR